MSRELARAIWTLRAADSVEDLTKRYRRLCKLFHPDVHSPDTRIIFESHMQQINEAYSQALQKFNIYTYRNPNKPGSANATFHAELLHDEPYSRSTREPEAPRPPVTPPPRPKYGAGVADSEAMRELGKALAVLKQARTFFSLKSTDDPDERACYDQALAILDRLRHRFPSLPAGQDALYYMAIGNCNLKNHARAIELFEEYRERYPQDSRSALFHFYIGLCRHRLGDFEQAALEYGYFLISQPGPQYRHFVALVATYKDAAELKTIPLALPYG